MVHAAAMLSDISAVAERPSANTRAFQIGIQIWQRRRPSTANTGMFFPSAKLLRPLQNGQGTVLMHRIEQLEVTVVKIHAQLVTRSLG